MWMNLVAVILLGVSLLVAVMPDWLERFLREDLRRSQARIRDRGERNAYIRADTDPDRLVLWLRVGAVAPAVLAIAMLAGLTR